MLKRIYICLTFVLFLQALEQKLWFSDDGSSSCSAGDCHHNRIPQSSIGILGHVCLYCRCFLHLLLTQSQVSTKTIAQGCLGKTAKAATLPTLECKLLRCNLNFTPKLTLTFKYYYVYYAKATIFFSRDKSKALAFSLSIYTFHYEASPSEFFGCAK